MSQADTPCLLWLDLRGSERSATLFELFNERFHIVVLNPHNPSFDTKALAPVAICFDFDYPDMRGLSLVRELHQRHRLPSIMMTEQHSESLMMWALRARVWEIFLKPLQRSAAEYQLDALGLAIADMVSDPEALTNVSPMLRLPEESRFHGANTDQRTLHPALSYMQLHLGERMSEEMLAQFCNLRPLQFSRLFKKAYGVTFQEMLQQLRIREATQLLENPDLQILDIALTVGYRDHSYFCRVFKKYMDVTPKTYQEQQARLSNQEQQAIIETRLQAVAGL
ncbi:MAG: helix-turn-helix domain-containing protein [Marinobacterium sp.]